jgi:hypothetical protein
MGESTTSTPYVRFALMSFAAFAVAVAALAYLGSEAAAEREREAAARDAAALVASPLRPIFDTIDKTAPASPEVRATVDPFVNTLLTGKVDGVRVATADGAVLYEAGARFLAEPAPPSAGGVTSAGGRSSDGANLFVTIAGADGYQIEIAEPAGPIDSLARDSTGLGGGQYGLVALFDEHTSEVILRATFDAQTGSVALHQRAIDDWFVRRCIATNTTIVSTLAEGSARQYFGAETQFVGDVPLLCAPMSIRDRVLGAIAVVGVTSGRGGFAPADVELVERLAAQAVTAVEQSQLLTKVRADAKELEASYDSTLKALMAALDAKDESTEGHCERVAKLTVQLARHMELPETMMVHIERGAMLHDVGKIGVPDEVLQKPDSLSENEWTTMRKHPMLAGVMVSKVGFLEQAMPILLYHHERFDGGGYPFGLAGGNIPIEARIFTIVDAYDAMTQDRPYRQAMTHLEAMDEIRAHNGTQFDPMVVEAFEHLMATRPDLRGTLAQNRVLTTDDAAHFAHDDEEHAA